MTLAYWFDRRRGLALSLALNGASAGGFIVTPVLARVVHKIGLGGGILRLVLAGFAILLPLIFACVSRAAPTRNAPDSRHATRSEPQHLPVYTSQAQALRSMHVWSIALPFALVLAAQVGFIVHQVAFLLPRIGNQGAANAVAATAAAAAAGRLAFAPVIDRLNQRLASSASFALQALGLGLMFLMPQQPDALYAGSIMFGLSVGNVITLPALIVQREFAAQSFGLVIGLVSTIGYTTLAFGPTLLGLARDATGNYAASLLVCIALQLAGAIIVVSRRG